MNLPNFLALLARRKWIVLLCILIPVIFITTNYMLAETQYSAITTLQLFTSSDISEEYNDIIQTESILNKYANIASSESIIAEIARSLSLSKAPIIDVDILTDQVLTEKDSLRLSITHPEPESAQAVTKILIEILTSQARQRPEFSEFPIMEVDSSLQEDSITAQEWLRSILLWSLIGLVIGSLLAYLYDSADPKLRSTIEIEQAAQLHTIAELPILKKNEPIVSLNGASAQSEAYRSLRTILTNFGGKNEIKTLLLTSANSGEGKSTIAVNLSIAMAQSGRKVLLVDCDMRKPAINEILSIPNLAGVSNVLLKQVTISDAIRHLPPFRFDVMTSGSPVGAPAELLNSSRMVKLVNDLEKKYDIVIFDAPAILPVTDAVILARFVSSVVLVVGKDLVEGREVEMAQRHLRSVNITPLGIIINRVKPRESKYYQ